MTWWEWFFDRKQTLSESYRMERETMGAILSRLDTIELRLSRMEFLLEPPKPEPRSRR